MKIDFGFSYIGLSIVLLLLIPNIIGINHLPQDYTTYAKQEKIDLRIGERVGEVGIICLLLSSQNFNIQNISAKIILLFFAYVFMACYEICWIRYFKSKRTMIDFYHSFLKIPIPLAILPICAFVMLGLYANHIYFLIATISFSIGHIGIHIRHYQQIKKNIK
ncbi:MAG: hypothetical protein NC182_03185 [Prevotella sp.]|nr:hypothetical protein [Staphylococcus sp.]MCM1350180.1 hypothetical protein [Prevotella sp.]